ncbi:hypothetical protein MKX57_16175 [Lysinibacillus sp. FSL M8-0216]|uniref:hypothetical protein n=1 Tax=unclassified Lysinibacillus TaxID=2636778 RepID=UPI00315AD710
MTILLPTPPGVEPLPLSISFDIDTRLDFERTQNTIIMLISFWEQHYEEKAVSGTSQWALCAEKYAEKEITPIWIDKEKGYLIDNGEKALNFLMDTLTEFFRENGTGKIRTAKIFYLDPALNSTMCSSNGYSEFCVPLDVAINPEALENVLISNLNLTGSLFHAWTHRMGYRHPVNVYTTYFSAEAAMCLMRGFQDKVTSEPDSVYTQYFDCTVCHSKYFPTLC